MSHPYLSDAAWRTAHSSEAQRRQSDEIVGRLAAGWSRGWRQLLSRRNGRPRLP